MLADDVLDLTVRSGILRSHSHLCRRWRDAVHQRLFGVGLARFGDANDVAIGNNVEAVSRDQYTSSDRNSKGQAQGSTLSRLRRGKAKTHCVRT